MKNISKYIIISAVTLFIIGLAWYFSNILAYILISAVISLIGQPIMRFLTSFQIGKWKISNSIASILTLRIIISAILGFIFFLTPLIGKIITELSEIKLGDLTQRMAIPLQKYNAMLHELVPTLEDSVSIESMILEHIRSAIKVGTVSVAFSSFANFLFHMVISAFIIIFVSFFFFAFSYCSYSFSSIFT
jgi:predicted PurR-regulated permease PerM